MGAQKLSYRAADDFQRQVDVAFFPAKGAFNARAVTCDTLEDLGAARACVAIRMAMEKDKDKKIAAMKCGVVEGKGSLASDLSVTPKVR